MAELTAGGVRSGFAPDAEAGAAGAEAARRAIPFRGGGFVASGYPWAAPILFASLIALWEIATRVGWIAPLTLPRPSAVAAELIGLAWSGKLAEDLLPSLGRLLVGGTLGALAGVAAGLAIGLFGLARATLAPLVAALFPIPKIALLPLFIIWFGIGEPSKYALIAFGVFTPTVIATYGGVDGVDRTLIRMGQSFGLSWFAIVRKIVLPGALPAILSGLRVSLAIAIILLVAAEMLGAQHGIGAYILLAGSLYDLEALFAGVAILSALGLGLSWAIGRLERRVLAWR